MNGPTDAELAAIEAEDAAFFERHPDRNWRLRLPIEGEPAEAHQVVAHRCGTRMALAPAIAWSSGDAAIEVALRDLSPAKWRAFQAAIARGQS